MKKINLKKSGYTLLELVVSILILLILAAMLFPVAARAVERSKIQESLGRLRQLHVAFTIYRDEWGTGGFDSPQEIGMPMRGYIYTTYFGLGKTFFESPCGYKDGIEANLKRLSYQYSWDGSQMHNDYYREYQENSLIFNDPHCNNDQTVWTNSYKTKRGLGVLMGGQLVNHLKRGFPGNLKWWSCPPQ